MIKNSSVVFFETQCGFDCDLWNSRR